MLALLHRVLILVARHQHGEGGNLAAFHSPEEAGLRLVVSSTLAPIAPTPSPAHLSLLQTTSQAFGELAELDKALGMIERDANVIDAPHRLQDLKDDLLDARLALGMLGERLCELSADLTGERTDAPPLAHAVAVAELLRASDPVAAGVEADRRLRQRATAIFHRDR